MEKSANQIKNGISRVICYVVTKWAMAVMAVGGAR